MRIKVALPDLVSNSYFPAIAAVELGFFKKEGIDAGLELIFPVPSCFESLREGQIDFVAGSAHAPLWAFPRWQGSKVLCSLSQGMYWFLVAKINSHIKKGHLDGLAGLKIAAAPGVDIGLVQLLKSAGVDPNREKIDIGLPSGGVPKGTSFGVAAAAWMQEGIIDAFWANGMGAEVAVTDEIAKIIIDVRRGDGPKEAFYFTQPALITTKRLIEKTPDVAAAAVRAIVNTQNALRENIELAAKVGKNLFPPKEAGLIADLIKRDLPFYDARISQNLIDGMNVFAMRAGLLDATPVSYDDIVAKEFSHIWELGK